MAGIHTQSGMHLNLLLLGMSGSGKTATLKSIVMRDDIQAQGGWETALGGCEQGEVTHGGRVINVLDTPGLFSTHMASDENQMELFRNAIRGSFQRFPGGFNALVLVLSYGRRYGQDDRDTIKIMRDVLGKDWLKTHGVALITSGDKFKRDLKNESFDDRCRKMPGPMGEIFKECNFRCVLFDNVTEDKEVVDNQRGRLVSVVEELGKRRFEMGFQDGNIGMASQSRKADMSSQNRKIDMGSQETGHDQPNEGLQNQETKQLSDWNENVSEGGGTESGSDSTIKISENLAGDPKNYVSSISVSDKDQSMSDTFSHVGGPNVAQIQKDRLYPSIPSRETNAVGDADIKTQASNEELWTNPLDGSNETNAVSDMELDDRDSGMHTRNATFAQSGQSNIHQNPNLEKSLSAESSKAKERNDITRLMGVRNDILDVCGLLQRDKIYWAKKTSKANVKLCLEYYTLKIHQVEDDVKSHKELACFQKCISSFQDLLCSQKKEINDGRCLETVTTRLEDSMHDVIEDLEKNLDGELARWKRVLT